jgi:hypothetical protein
LPGEPAETPWNPPLAGAMLYHRVRIEEEFVLDTVLHDLAAGFVGCRPQGLGGLPDLLCADACQ